MASLFTEVTWAAASAAAKKLIDTVFPLIAVWDIDDTFLRERKRPLRKKGAEAAAAADEMPAGGAFTAAIPGPVDLLKRMFAKGALIYYVTARTATKDKIDDALCALFSDLDAVGAPHPQVAYIHTTRVWCAPDFTEGGASVFVMFQNDLSPLPPRDYKHAARVFIKERRAGHLDFAIGDQWGDVIHWKTPDMRKSKSMLLPAMIPTAPAPRAMTVYYGAIRWDVEAGTTMVDTRKMWMSNKLGDLDGGAVFAIKLPDRADDKVVL